MAEIGDWFTVPLADPSGRVAVGRVARLSPDGALMLGYFFAPARAAGPARDELDRLTPEAAVLRARASTDGFAEGRWRVFAHGDLDRRRWEFPAFRREEPILGLVWRVEYDDEDPWKVVREVRATREEVLSLPRNGSYGSVAVERALAALLSEGDDADESVVEEAQPPKQTTFYLYFGDESLARDATNDLGRIGAASVEPSADGRSWLVQLESDRAVDEVEPLVADIADRYGGEYDGLERPVMRWPRGPG